MYDIFLQVVDLVHTLGYIGIFVMTLVEGTFVPIPNEVTLIPAGFLVAKGEMNIVLVLFISIAGNILGSLISYYIAFTYGRSFISQYGKYFFLSPKKLKKIEDFFARHGPFSVFIGRIMPGIKHFISFPAGLAKMDVKVFCAYTGSGGAIWVTILTVLGYLIGENDTLIKKYTGYIKYGALLLCLFLTIFYVVKNHLSRKKN